MEKIKILTISQTVSGKDYYLKEIEAIPIQIRNWEEFRFYVHRSDSNNCVWRVTDAGSGVSVGVRELSKVKAISEAEKLLNQKGKQAFAWARKEYVELFNKLNE